ncbi:MAG TPA: hypothetical protein DD738_03670 [Ruminiclostridium sp.]|nr:hypothetical protein [Ruminiclostridium sp.]
MIPSYLIFTKDKSNKLQKILKYKRFENCKRFKNYKSIEVYKRSVDIKALTCLIYIRFLSCTG